MKKIKPYYGAGLLLWTQNEQEKKFVLLGKRSIHPGKGKWSIPGGRWSEKKDSYDENGEPYYLKTALRETEEELSLLIKKDDNIIHLWRSRCLPFFHFVVYAHQLSEQVTIIHFQEFSELKWFPAEDLPVDCVRFVESQVSILVR